MINHAVRMTVSAAVLDHPAGRDRLAHPKYRPDIDGLRAIAVLSVIGFHAFPTWVRGGFIGVDIFFVISGFLISTIILGNLQRDSFSYKVFYARRIKRIFPALILILAATGLFGWYVLLTDEYTQVGAHIAGGAGFVSNFVLWTEQGYFDNAADSKPLLHLWSLGIEEQFYLAWPLVLTLAWKRRHTALLAILFTAAASFTICVVTTRTDGVAAFYSPLSRVWELMIGSVLAYLALRRPHDWFRGSNWQSVTGVLLILGGLLTITNDKAFPGWWALLPTVGAFLVISAGPAAWLNRNVLANRVLVWIGLISYPLYLWHWPLLSYGWIINGGLPARTIRFLLIFASVVLAWLTYGLWEKRFRRIESWNSTVTSLAVVLALFVAIGLGMRLRLPGPRMPESGARVYAEAMGDWDFPSRGLKARRVGLNTVHEIRTDNAGVTLFVGDSYAQQYGPRVDSVVGKNPERYNSVVFATAGGCPPIAGVYRLPRSAFYPCESMRATAFELARSPEIDAVVLGTDWYGLLSAAEYDSHLVFVREATSVAFPDPEALDLAFASLGRTLAELSQQKRVYVLLPLPKEPKFDPRNMLEGSRFRQLMPKTDLEPVDITTSLARHKRVRDRLVATALSSGAILVDPVSTLCKASLCPVVDERGRPLFKDNGHMRPFYVRDSASFIDQTITADRQANLVPSDPILSRWRRR
jgi:peptidoglycan/LPS O-acetylase OafA/YrhL